MKVPASLSLKQVLWGGSSLVVVVLALPNLGKGLEALMYVVRAFPTAYAADAKVERVDDRFDQYLAQQEKSAIAQQAAADALNAYIGQQQATPPPAWMREWDEDTQTYWCCSLSSLEECDVSRQWRRCP